MKQIIIAGTSIEAIAILLCAISIYPSSWKNKSIGLLVGLVALNIIQIISLYFIGNIPSLFEVINFPFLIIVFEKAF